MRRITLAGWTGRKSLSFESHLRELMWRWWDQTPRPEAILRLIKEFFDRASGLPAFTAGYPIFQTWSRQSSDSLEDCMSQTDSSDDEDYNSTASTSHSAAAAADQSASDTSAPADTSTLSRLSLKVSEWVSSFLTAHQHVIGYSVPYNGLGNAIKDGKYNQGYLATIKYE